MKLAIAQLPQQRDRAEEDGRAARDGLPVRAVLRREEVAHEAGHRVKEIRPILREPLEDARITLRGDKGEGAPDGPMGPVLEARDHRMREARIERARVYHDGRGWRYALPE